MRCIKIVHRIYTDMLYVGRKEHLSWFSSPMDTWSRWIPTPTTGPSRSRLSIQTGSSSPGPQAEVIPVTYYPILFIGRCQGHHLGHSACHADTLPLSHGPWPNGTTLCSFYFCAIAYLQWWNYLQLISQTAPVALGTNKALNNPSKRINASVMHSAGPCRPPTQQHCPLKVPASICG